MFDFRNLDWWLFIYSPCVFLSAGLIFGFRRWTRVGRAANIVPMFALLAVRVLISWSDIFLDESFFYFSVLYFSCFWILIANLESPGISAFSFGGIMNATAALVNGGKMPVFGENSTSFFHQPMGQGVRFGWLCDWIATPHNLYMMSPGDFLLIVGSVIFFMQEFRIRMSAGKVQ